MLDEIVQVAKKKFNDLNMLYNRRSQLFDLVLYSGGKVRDAKKEIDQACDKIYQENPDSNTLWIHIKAIDMVEDKYLSEVWKDYKRA